MHTPGLKVVMPSTPYDAKGLLEEPPSATTTRCCSSSTSCCTAAAPRAARRRPRWTGSAPRSAPRRPTTYLRAPRRRRRQAPGAGRHRRGHGAHGAQGPARRRRPRGRGHRGRGDRSPHPRAPGHGRPSSPPCGRRAGSWSPARTCSPAAWRRDRGDRRGARRSGRSMRPSCGSACPTRPSPSPRPASAAVIPQAATIVDGRALGARSVGVSATRSAYIFDFDGVLVNTMEAHFACYTRALRRGRRAHRQRQFFSQAGMTGREQIACFAARAGKTIDVEAVYRRKGELFLGHLEEVLPIPAGVELLASGAGRRLADGHRLGQLAPLDPAGDRAPRPGLRRGGHLRGRDAGASRTRTCS